MLNVIIGREYPDRVINEVKQAKQSVKILMFAWRWYHGEIGTRIQKFNHEIIKAKNRGVDVFALTNFDYVCGKFKSQNIKIAKPRLKNLLHAKIIIIDGKLLFLGSHNLTKNAFEINHEISIMTDEQSAVARCSQFFDNIAKQSGLY